MLVGFDGEEVSQKDFSLSIVFFELRRKSFLKEKRPSERMWFSIFAWSLSSPHGPFSVSRGPGSFLRLRLPFRATVSEPQRPALIRRVDKQEDVAPPVALGQAVSPLVTIVVVEVFDVPRLWPGLPGTAAGVKEAALLSIWDTESMASRSTNAEAKGDSTGLCRVLERWWPGVLTEGSLLVLIVLWPRR